MVWNDKPFRDLMAFSFLLHRNCKEYSGVCYEILNFKGIELRLKTRF